MQQLIDNTKVMQRWNETMKTTRAKKARAMATRIQRSTLREAAANALHRLFSGPTPSCTHSRVIAGANSATPKR